MRDFRRQVLLAALLLWAGAVAAEVAVPALRARVTDLTGSLDAARQAALERKLQAFEARKGSQIAVLLLPTTQPESIEQYGIRVAEQWKLGRKGIDDGALLLVALRDRSLRIEVGYGLEGALSDLVSKRIVDDIIAPRFRQGDFAGGIDAGVDAMIRVIDGEPLPEPDARPPGFRQEALQRVLLVAFVAVFVVGGVLRAVLGRLPAAALVGLVVGALGWWLLASLAVGLAVAALAFLFTLLGGLAGPGRVGRGWGGMGGPGMGGGFGGSGGFGGGFGGGGGGFGGGGASGRW